MTQQHTAPELAAVLAVDVVCYNRFMGMDELPTLHTLNAFRALLGGLIAEHEGIAFGGAGNSVIAEFASSVEAALCSRNPGQLK